MENGEQEYRQEFLSEQENRDKDALITAQQKLIETLNARMELQQGQSDAKERKITHLKEQMHTSTELKKKVLRMSNLRTYLIDDLKTKMEQCSSCIGRLQLVEGGSSSGAPPATSTSSKGSKRKHAA